MRMGVKVVLRDFKDFILSGNVVDLAVAVIIGGAFGQVVNSMVADVLTPIVGAIFGRPDFAALTLGPVLIGEFINAVVNFITVAAVVYFAIVVPMKKVQEMKAKKEEAAGAPAVPEDIRLLSEILETLRSQGR